eukprot:TRINITY_DN44899_c0_g1_i1.p2 TRINITY_DN44899_c0_g1~~TRINITY_DN44899_c0_g1_i1.p2  ORF type:complete len:266 (-),score=-6.27 TRINITY_DN44899_c0_g1_i1:245-1042(-)
MLINQFKQQQTHFWIQRGKLFVCVILIVEFKKKKKILKVPKYILANKIDQVFELIKRANNPSFFIKEKSELYELKVRLIYVHSERQFLNMQFLYYIYLKIQQNKQNQNISTIHLCSMLEFSRNWNDTFLKFRDIFVFIFFPTITMFRQYFVCQFGRFFFPFFFPHIQMQFGYDLYAWIYNLWYSVPAFNSSRSTYHQNYGLVIFLKFYVQQRLHFWWMKFCCFCEMKCTCDLWETVDGIVWIYSSVFCNLHVYVEQITSNYIIGS